MRWKASIFIAGAAVQWLRDGLKLVEHRPARPARWREAADPNQQVYLVPAFVGLGAPYWDAEARGAIFGLTRGTGPSRNSPGRRSKPCATRPATCCEAMQKDWAGGGKTVLRVDGGMTASDWTMQFLADILDAPVDRPTVLETTALGAAYLAGLQAGLLPKPSEFAKSWKRGKRFTPKMKAAERETKYAGWQEAVRKLLA